MSHVMTVLGPVSPEEIGPTMMHEHLFKDTGPWVWDPDELADPDSGTSRIDATLGGPSRWNNRSYRDNLAFWPDEAFLTDYLEQLLTDTRVATTKLPETMRV